ncbi:MAG TPA: hypothetical protein VF792_04060 [Ktedonobacterales bacterium]
MVERQCLRCGAPYEEGATVCFTCGASIGELETPTQPVRAPKRPVPAPEPAPAQQPVAPVITALPTMPRPQTVGSRYNAPTRPIPRPKRRWPMIVAIVVVVAALTGVGFGVRAFFAPAPVPTTTTYHDPQRRFSFTEPSLWTVTTQATGALIADSNGANTVTITVATPPSGKTASQVADSLATQQQLESATPVSIAGDEWEQRTGSVTGLDGATRVVTLYVDVHAGELYTIETSSPTSVANSINTVVYQPLLASFAFK